MIKNFQNSHKNTWKISGLIDKRFTMWEPTKTHHIEEVESTSMGSNSKKNWRDFFKKNLAIHNEQGFYLKGLRLLEGYTQVQLGEQIGISQNNISAMEHGHRSIGKEIALRLS